jgi:SNF2 family DNA or RNA helicase
MKALAEFKPVLYTGSESPTQKDAAKKAFVEGDSRVIIISLRAGAGLNGLQEVCNTAVFGEFDWSPGVHEQCTGRVWRDGVMGQVMAYYLMSEEGSDPEIASVLGIKLSQIQGIRDPDADIIEELEVEAGNVKRLAESYLARCGTRESVEEAVAA